jgi:hypothetical protein
MAQSSCATYLFLKQEEAGFELKIAALMASTIDKYIMIVNGNV